MNLDGLNHIDFNISIIQKYLNFSVPSKWRIKHKITKTLRNFLIYSFPQPMYKEMMDEEELVQVNMTINIKMAMILNCLGEMKR